MKNQIIRRALGSFTDSAGIRIFDLGNTLHQALQEGMTVEEYERLLVEYNPQLSVGFEMAEIACEGRCKMENVVFTLRFEFSETTRAQLNGLGVDVSKVDTVVVPKLALPFLVAFINTQIVMFNGLLFDGGLSRKAFDTLRHNYSNFLDVLATISTLQNKSEEE